MACIIGPVESQGISHKDVWSDHKREFTKVPHGWRCSSNLGCTPFFFRYLYHGGCNIFRPSTPDSEALAVCLSILSSLASELIHSHVKQDRTVSAEAYRESYDLLRVLAARCCSSQSTGSQKPQALQKKTKKKNRSSWWKYPEYQQMYLTEEIRRRIYDCESSNCLTKEHIANSVGTKDCYKCKREESSEVYKQLRCTMYSIWSVQHISIFIKSPFTQ